MRNLLNQKNIENASDNRPLDPKSLVTSFQSFRVYKNLHRVANSPGGGP
jgi:hypothetical protein